MINPIELGTVVQQTDNIELSPQRREIATGGEEGDKQSFADALSNAINSVDETMKTSDQQVQDFIAGESDNVHDVMISMQRAQMSFEMMVEIRNKAVETYQEISRMQI
ncbi:flagellar hook-basal body complex protein FliE [Fodinibius roseus]|uniref:Flagellar hook-basal body complex protein FliE n=1 Tax=Fodinibius roseus TaxID=1194090 RepID=A0A1M5HGW0_9BACT|nr:flagellar hook-basal body complex protein FliE [Fodinibius roseus]SHG15118.1 flagellar hook-basal body complex protein FliE [Fodinibius roseus]